MSKDNVDGAEILQRIYRSEIALSLGWMFDGGIDYRIGVDLSEMYVREEDKLVKSTGTANMKEALIIIADLIAVDYPDSEFTKWWLDEEKPDELFELGKPLIKWLNDKHNPHAKILISTSSMELLIGERGYPTTEFIKD